MLVLAAWTASVAADGTTQENYEAFLGSLDLIRLPPEIGHFKFMYLRVEPGTYDRLPRTDPVVQIRFKYNRWSGHVNTAELEGSFVGRETDQHLLHDVIGAAFLGHTNALPVRKVGDQIVFAILHDDDWLVQWYGGDGNTASFIMEKEGAFPSDAAAVFLKHLPSKITEQNLAPYPTYAHWARVELNRRLREIESCSLNSLAPANPDAKELGPTVYNRRQAVKYAMEIIYHLTRTKYPEISELVTPFADSKWTIENTDTTQELAACIKALSSWWKEAETDFDPGESRHILVR